MWTKLATTFIDTYAFTKINNIDIKYSKLYYTIGNKDLIYYIPLTKSIKICNTLIELGCKLLFKDTRINKYFCINPYNFTINPFGHD